MRSETIIANDAPAPPPAKAAQPPARPAGQRPAAPQAAPVQAPPVQAPPVQAPPVQAKPAEPQKVPAAVAWARMRLRHYGILFSFLAIVVAPALATLAYLYLIAEDQYASTVSFSVRSEEIAPSLSLLGSLSSLQGNSTVDADILYEYIQSQDLVQGVDEKLDLRAIYSKATGDPVFAFDKDGSIEDLVAYWGSMVKIFYDRGTGLIELRVQAFDPHDAQNVAAAIYADSSRLINQLSATGREDTTRYAKEDLDAAVTRLKEARTALTEFRSRTQIVDPSADIQSQMGLLSTLQQQLTAAMIELNLLQSSASPKGDPRIGETERRIAVIQKMIEDERAKFGVGSAAKPGDDSFSTLVGEFERLSVDREFAEKAYLAALAAYDGAVAAAQRQNRYLAAHVRPTLAEAALYPQRLQISLVVFALLLAIWGILMLVYYSVRDRR